jgi:hypothetical protein
MRRRGAELRSPGSPPGWHGPVYGSEPGPLSGLHRRSPPLKGELGSRLAICCQHGQGDHYSQCLRGAHSAARPSRRRPGHQAELADVGRLARRVIPRTVTAARTADNSVSRLLADHLGRAGGLPVARAEWPGYDRVNVQTGLDAWLAEPGRTHQLSGLTQYRHREFGLADLLQRGARHTLGIGSVETEALPCAPGGATRPCVQLRNRPAGSLGLERPGAIRIRAGHLDADALRACRVPRVRAAGSRIVSVLFRLCRGHGGHRSGS